MLCPGGKSLFPDLRMADDTAAVQSIINQLKHDDCQVRAKATGRLTTVAAALGPERTRTELLPFLQGKHVFLLLLTQW